ncbi:MAG: TetR/AcrR family transcriptional regulator [Bryobacteraceae bacterium]|jgi:AcrR family transcriptional regulator
MRAPIPPVLADDEDLPPAPQQKRSLATRQKLLDAGRNLFAEQGYHATSIQAIASRAGIAAGAFYTYYRSKRQLLIVLMTELLARLRDLDLRPKGGAAGTDSRAGLRTFLAAVFRADLEYYGVVRAWQEAALTDAGLGRMQTAIESWTNARILGVFRLLRQYPNARPNRDLPAFARMMDRHFWSILARGASLPPRDFNREVRIAADVIYHYLFHDPLDRPGEGNPLPDGHGSVTPCEIGATATEPRPSGSARRRTIPSRAKIK